MRGQRGRSVRRRRMRRVSITAVPAAGVVWRTVLVFLLVFGTVGGAGTATQMYNEANALYRKGEFEAAAGRYTEVVSQGVRNGYVYFNLGNAYFKTGEIGQAILAYERALRLMPGDEDVLANLRFVNVLKEDRNPDDDVNLPTRLILSVYRHLSANVLAVLSSICLLMMSAAAVFWLYSTSRRSVWIGLLVLMGLGLSGSGTLLSYRVYSKAAVSDAVVLADDVQGRSGPGDDYLLVFTVHEGTKVGIERVENRWYLVRLPNGIGGWVPGDTVGKI